MRKWHYWLVMGGLSMLAGVMVGQTKPASDAVIWGNGAGSDGSGGVAGTQGHFRLKTEANAPFTFSPATSPYVYCEKQVWDMKTGKAFGHAMSQDFASRWVRALSPDGKHIGAFEKSDRSDSAGMEVWSTETGEKLWDKPEEKMKSVDYMGFGGSWVVVGGRDRSTIRVYDAATGKLVKTMLAGEIREPNMAALTTDGKYFACRMAEGRSEGQIGVYDLRAGQRLAVMNLPAARVDSRAKVGPDSAESIARDPMGSAKAQWPFVAAWARVLAFSPDSRELAMLTQHPGPRLVVWNTQGKVVFDEELPAALRTGDESLEWVPDGSGWLLGGQMLFDRKSKRVVWETKRRFGGTSAVGHFLNHDSLVMPFGEPWPDTLATVELPWDRIAKSLAAMNGKGAALLRSGDSLSVEFEMVGLRGDADTTTKGILDALTKGLAKEHIKIAEGQKTVMKVTWQEAAGEKMEIVEKTSPFDMHGKKTGQTAEDTTGTLLLELRSGGRGPALWSQRLRPFSQRTFQGDINNGTVRESLLKTLYGELEGLEMPYFIPLEPGVEALPIRAEGEPEAAGQ